MLDRFKAFLSGDTGPSASTGERVVLAVAALMAEVAMIDGALSEKEREHMVHLLRTRFGLPPIAAEAAADRAIALQDRPNQLFPLTKEIVEHCEPGERVGLMEVLWEIAYANGRLDDYEANLMRRLAGLLYVSDQDSGSARRQAMAGLGISDGPWSSS